MFVTTRVFLRDNKTMVLDINYRIQYSCMPSMMIILTNFIAYFNLRSHAALNVTTLTSLMKVPHKTYENFSNVKM
jgi:hypothetical protein